jgi:hypothetical protein
MGQSRVYLDTTRLEVEKIANEMSVMEAPLKEMIGVEHSGEVQGWLNEEEPAV